MAIFALVKCLVALSTHPRGNDPGQWLQNCYTDLFRSGTPVRVHPYGDPWPVQMEGLNSQQRIRNWQKVLAGKKADSLEAALLMAALKNAVAEDLKFCLVLFALPANPEKDEEEKRFLLAWSPRGRVWQAIEIAWAWLRYQPHSKLSQWFSGRIANGGSRMRRIGIVALARRLLVDLWRFLEYGVVPEGALLTS